MKSLKLVFGSLLIMLLSVQFSVAQTYNLSNNSSTLKVDGTSNLHDWSITSNNQKGKMTAEVNDGKVTKIQALEFSVATESLKSGKSGMDKNTYKALKSDKHKQITFTMNNVKSLNCSSANSCKATVNGNLNIAGVSKPVDITFDIKVSGSSITLNGNRKIKMTDYKVDPPTAMLGTITTGNEVNVIFKSVFTR